jgi:hypothetical protein
MLKRSTSMPEEANGASPEIMRNFKKNSNQALWSCRNLSTALYTPVYNSSWDLFDEGGREGRQAVLRFLAFYRHTH